MSYSHFLRDGHTQHEVLQHKENGKNALQSSTQLQQGHWQQHQLD